ncbi:hypothetical protein ACFW2Y_02800 [Streptomyces sp. NPDC058877]|uniref:hypothetical protein n=1 Tax=Streptomyces sp. NPDC058877 TaxID=3346665 RepID=UPI00369AEED9
MNGGAEDPGLTPVRGAPTSEAFEEQAAAFVAEVVVESRKSGQPVEPFAATGFLIEHAGLRLTHGVQRQEHLHRPGLREALGRAPPCTVCATARTTLGSRAAVLVPQGVVDYGATSFLRPHVGKPRR